MTNEQVINLLKEKRVRQEGLTDWEKITLDGIFRRVFVDLEKQATHIEFEKGVKRMVMTTYGTDGIDDYQVPIFPVWKRQAILEYLTENGFAVFNDVANGIAVKLNGAEEI